jgi:hypothetical protein
MHNAWGAVLLSLAVPSLLAIAMARRSLARGAHAFLQRRIDGT